MAAIVPLRTGGITDQSLHAVFNIPTSQLLNVPHLGFGLFPGRKIGEQEYTHVS
jgi:hypothetical protein